MFCRVLHGIWAYWMNYADGDSANTGSGTLPNSEQKELNFYKKGVDKADDLYYTSK